MDDSLSNLNNKPKYPDNEITEYLKAMKEEFENVTENRSFLRKFFNEIKQNEGSLSSTKKTSFILQEFLAHLYELKEEQSIDIIIIFLSNIYPYVVWLATDRYGSHILEDLFRISLALIIEFPEEDNTKQLIEKYSDLFSVLLLSDHTLELLFSVSSSNVLRTALQLLSLDHEMGNNKRRLNKIDQVYHQKHFKKKIKVPLFSKILTKFLTWFSKLEDDVFFNIGYNNSASLVFQKLLTVTSSYLSSVATKANTTKNNSGQWLGIAFRIFDEPRFEIEKGMVDLEKFKRKFLQLSCKAASSYLVQTIVQSMSPKELSTTVCQAIQNKSALDKLAANKFGNYVLQPYLKKLEKDQLIYVITSFLPSIKLNLLNKNLELLEVVIDQAKQCSTQQQLELINAVKQGFSTGDRAGYLFLKAPIFNTGAQNLSTVGCRVMFNLLLLSPHVSRLLFKELNELTNVEFKEFCHLKFVPQYLIEPFFETRGTPIPENTKKRASKLFTKRLLQSDTNNPPLLLSLAMNNSTWYTVRKMFDFATDKELIVKVLQNNREKLLTNNVGLKLSKHVKLELYIKNKRAWQNLYSRKDEKHFAKKLKR